MVPMMIERSTARPLGTMVTYGFAARGLESDLAIARQLGASVLEILPDWRSYPDARSLRTQLADSGLVIHSAHGCWGGRAIEAARVDLASLDPAEWSASVDDLKRCVDWLALAGGTCLVAHPGGLSDPVETDARRDALARALVDLADHAKGIGIVLCVENMPPGVHPGSRMDDLAGLVAAIDRNEVALALDTGHANLTAGVRAETVAAGRLLRTTHVHDNDGRQDTHLPPGLGTIDWDDWVSALDLIGYEGPIMLECIRHLRRHPESLCETLIEVLGRLTAPSAA
jgi:sugar phosphate isomerase/epimerase